MDLAFNLIIGNIISFIAGIFIILSMWVNDEKEAYKYQFLNAFILMISSVFFFSWTGVTTMAIAASRNAFVYKDKLTFNNTRGIIGFLPIIAIVQITICNYYLKSIKSIKTSFIVNSAFYIVYFLTIYDFSSCAFETITVIIGLISLFKLIFADKEDEQLTEN